MTDTVYQHEKAPDVAADDRPPTGVVVMKFGGTSVGDAERIRQVAERLVAARAAGAGVVGVVSAMERKTDELIELAHRVSASPDPRELDMLLTVGERISCALVAMAINDLGREAVSLAGSQAGIVTDTVHGKARIVEVRARRIRDALAEGRIVLVAGFQGMSTDLDITTLGRGGTDATAVALASALDAGACEIYSDVAGVFTADPCVVAGRAHAPCGDLRGDARDSRIGRHGPSATLRRVGAEPRRQAARALDLQRRARARGSWRKASVMEKAIISAVTHTREEAVYRVHGLGPAALCSALADRQVNVDTIIQTSADVIVFSAPLEDRGATASTLDELGASWSEHDDLGKVSVVGAGMKSHPGIAARTFTTLRDLGVEPQFISTSPIKIAFYVPHASSSVPSRRSTRPSSSGSLKMTDIRIGVVGATGAVGTITLELLAERGFERIRAFASARSAGSRVRFGDRDLTVEEATPAALAAGELDLCFFSVGTATSQALVPHAVEGGAVVIDKSDAYRLTDGIPLVVAGVNDDALHEDPIIANPNCSAMQLTCVLRPLEDAAGLARVRLATYQSMSGAGDAGIEKQKALEPMGADLGMDWELGWRRVQRGVEASRGEPQDPRAPGSPASRKLRARPRARRDTRRLSGSRRRMPLSPDEAAEAINAAPHVMLADLPTPLQAAGRDEVLVGPDTTRFDRGTRPRALDRERQPPQGRSTERRADRRAPARAALDPGLTTGR